MVVPKALERPAMTDDKLIEAMARQLWLGWLESEQFRDKAAHWDTHGLMPDSDKQPYFALALAALTAIEQAGYVVLPRDAPVERVAKITPMFAESDGSVIGYMCATDWEYEMGMAAGGNIVFPSLEDAKEHLRCWRGCGIVRVRVSFEALEVSGDDPAARRLED